MGPRRAYGIWACQLSAQPPISVSSFQIVLLLLCLPKIKMEVKRVRRIRSNR